MTDFQLALCKRYLQLQGKKFERHTRIKCPDGKTREFIVYSDESGVIPSGQKVPFLRFITIDHKILTDFSKNTRNYFLAHESAHTYGGIITDLIIAILLSPFVFLALYSFASGIWLNAPIIVEIRSFLVQYVVSILLIWVFMFFGTCWIMEFYADWCAIRILGSKQVWCALKEMKKKSELVGFKKWYNQLLGLLTHPPLSFILKVYEYF